MKGSKNITKNQHIVPQRHLKNFSTPNNKNKIISFDCDEMKVPNKEKSIKSVCSGYFHYALEPGIEDEYSQAVEDAFGNLEIWYGDNIKRIEESLLNKEKLSDSDRFGLSCVISNFFFRAQNFRKESLDALKELVDSMQPTVSEHIYNEASKKYPDVFSNKEHNKEIADKVIKEGLHSIACKTSHATNVAFDVGLANTLTHKKWDIYINSTNYPFITSDEAVIDLMNPKIPENHMMRGAWLLKTQIFSLSPKVLIKKNSSMLCIVHASMNQWNTYERHTMYHFLYTT